MNCIVHGVAKSQTRLSDFHFEGTIKINLDLAYEGNTAMENLFSFLLIRLELPKFFMMISYVYNKVSES